ncbi:DUF6933 domain-containing protein [Photobacterium leiognathi]|uniref:DUF6933 domain-containing protein n=1 Tax=Photobacterium leiognathi lrivu.4.1 TaxID=1248232 RepID=V5F7P1_PHOLE|nr:hypothetical protein [Photobacterium leiognathi]GAD31329.1 conserved hypothetical protein [Photobacterium leiognathi lrivu.4.1]
MLVFNCTKAAADFFTVKRNGKKVSPLEAPPTDSISNSEPVDAFSTQPPMSAWLVHAVNVQRKKVLIAMHVETRYSMVFVGIQKGDWFEFTNQLLERLFNNMQFFGEEFEMCDEESFEEMFNEFIKLHPKPYFCQRGDRSVQSHINDVAWQFENRVYQAGSLPEGHEQSASFDEWINSLIRSTKQKNDHFHPDEEMFIDWMQTYSKLGDNEDKLIRQLFSSLRRQMMHAEMVQRGIPDDSYLDEMNAELNQAMNEYYEGIGSIPNNVIDFNQAKSKYR